jgi:hypothetical protein
MPSGYRWPAPKHKLNKCRCALSGTSQPDSTGLAVSKRPPQRQVVKTVAAWQPCGDVRQVEIASRTCLVGARRGDPFANHRGPVGSQPGCPTRAVGRIHPGPLRSAQLQVGSPSTVRSPGVTADTLYMGLWVWLLIAATAVITTTVISGTRAWRKFGHAKPDIFLEDEQRRTEPPDACRRAS